MVVVAAGFVVAGCDGPAATVDAAAIDAPIDADEGVGSRVLVHVIGVRDPMSVVLHDVEADVDQAILVTEDSDATSPFRFPRRLPEGESFTISIAGSQTCLPAVDGVVGGTIAGANLTIAFLCDGVLDLEAVPSTPALRVLPRFDPRIIVNPGAEPLLAEPGEPMTLSPVPRYAAASVTLTPPTLAVAVDPTVDITVSYPPFPPRTYTVALTRSLLLEAYAKASDSSTGAHFGGMLRDVSGATSIGTSAIAISGDTLVIGAPDHLAGTGAAYVFKRKGLSWAMQAPLVAPVPISAFGSSVAIDGETIVVGARTDGPSGAAYVFQRTGNDWARVAELRQSLDANALFGAAVAIAGPYIVIGAPHHGGASSRNGTAVVFHDVGGWSFDRALQPVPAVTDGQFGSAVAISGLTIAVGAPSVLANQGAAYVYSGASWGQVFSSNGANSSLFGTSIGLDEDLLAIGAPNENTGQPQSGAVYVFRFAGTWAASGKLTGSPITSADHFGFSVAVGRRSTATATKYHVLVGAPDEDSVAGSSGGVFYFRCGTTGACPAQERLQKASNVGGSDRFGTSVAIDGDTFAVGAPSEASSATLVNGNQASNDAPSSGAVYVFR